MMQVSPPPSTLSCASCNPWVAGHKGVRSVVWEICDGMILYHPGCTLCTSSILCQVKGEGRWKYIDSVIVCDCSRIL